MTATASDVAVEFVVGELDREYVRREKLLERSSAVITSSGTLTTLILAIGAFARGTDEGKFSLATLPLALAGVGIVGFAIAAAIGIASSRPRQYKVLAADSLFTMSELASDQPPTEVQKVIMAVTIKTTDSLRTGNSRNAELLSLAYAFQGAAVALLVLSVLLAAFE